MSKDISKILIALLSTSIVSLVSSVSVAMITNARQDERISHLDREVSKMATDHDIENAKLMLRLEIQKRCK